MYEAAFANSGPSPPSSNASSCGAMPEYHSSGVTNVAGIADTRLLARLSESWVMFAPRFCGTAASDTLTVPEGWTENTNSSVARTPSGRSGTRVSSFITSLRSQGGAAFGLSKTFSAGMRWPVLALETGQTWAAHKGHGWLGLPSDHAVKIPECSHPRNVRLLGVEGIVAGLDDGLYQRLAAALLLLTLCLVHVRLGGGRDCGSVQKQ